MCHVGHVINQNQRGFLWGILLKLEQKKELGCPKVVEITSQAYPVIHLELDQSPSYYKNLPVKQINVVHVKSLVFSHA